MARSRFVIGLIVVHLLLIVLVAAQPGSSGMPQEVLRGRALELVDGDGHVRARMDVDEAGEVVLRMMDRNGIIRVKLGAAEHGSALLLVDDLTEPGVHIIARRTPTGNRPATTSITLRGAAAEPRVIRP